MSYYLIWEINYGGEKGHTFIEKYDSHISMINRWKEIKKDDKYDYCELINMIEGVDLK